MTPEFSRPLRADGFAQGKRHEVVANAGERAALALRFDLIALDGLSAALEIGKAAGGPRVTGRVTATATQRCAVSGLPVTARIDEAVDLRFAAAAGRPGDEEVELEAQAGQIILRPARSPRQGWDEAFRAMSQHGDDRLLDGETASLSQWDETEWQW